jgi:hypothetical protein
VRHRPLSITGCFTTVVSAVLVFATSGIVTAGCASDANDLDPSSGKADGDIPELENGVPVAVADHGAVLFRFEVPENQTFVRVELDGPGGVGDGPDADLYLRRGAPPTATRFDLRDLTVGPHEVVEPPPLPGTWFALVKLTGTIAGVTLAARWNDTEIGTRIVERGVPIVLPGIRDDVLLYLDVPPGKSNLKFDITTQAGDPTMCVGLFDVPHVTENVNTVRCAPGGTQGDHRADLFLPRDSEGPWLISVGDSFLADVSNLELVATYDDEPIATPEPIGVGATQITVAANDSSYYVFDVPEGAERLTINVTNASDTGTLWARPGHLPTKFFKQGLTNFFDFSDGSLTIDQPVAGPWFLRVDDGLKVMTATLTISID